jgi:dTDP-4-amino-4,6-dideoxygalactose transaminase
LLCRIGPGDEVVMPSFTFVSTANAFALRGATIRFVDSLPDHPNLDHEQVEALVNSKTRAIVPVHYAGVACEMDVLKAIATRHSLKIVEDAAQGIDATFRGRPLGTLGELAAFSFHETKNVSCGEGGSLHINDSELVARAEVLREKGTNRAAFFRGQVDKYSWVDVGSSFLPSDLLAAFLLAQLESLSEIQVRRHAIWRAYHERLADVAKTGRIHRPVLREYAQHNAHMYYLVCESLDVRTRLMEYLKAHQVMAVFHYQSLHRSAYFADKHDGRNLPNADRYSECLVRLPLYGDMTVDDVDRVCELISAFFREAR